MKHATRALMLVLSVTFKPLASGATATDSAAPQVWATDLNTLRIPGKVAGVIWTVRPERCTLQIVFPNAGRIAEATGAYPKPGFHRLSVQAWLLRADGSSIPSSGRVEAGKPDLRQPYGAEVLLAYPREARSEAVAVALEVDDVFAVEPLHRS